MKIALTFQALSYLLLHSKGSYAAYIASNFNFDNNRASLVKIEDGKYSQLLLKEEGIVSYGVTYDPISGRIYSLDENEDYSLKLVSSFAFDGEETSVPISPSNVVLDCLTSGPAGIYSLDTTGRIGKINTETGKWTALLNEPLPGPYDSFVTAQDDDGTLHYINGDGKYYIMDKDNLKLKRVRGATFPTDHQSFCGDFTEKNIITAVKFNSGRSAKSIVKYNIKNMDVTTEKAKPSTNFLDITRSEILDKSSLPTMSPTAPTKGSKKSKKGAKGISSKGNTKSKYVKYPSNIYYHQNISILGNESNLAYYNNYDDEIDSNQTYFNTSYYSNNNEEEQNKSAYTYNEKDNNTYSFNISSKIIYEEKTMDNAVFAGYSNLIDNNSTRVYTLNTTVLDDSNGTIYRVVDNIQLINEEETNTETLQDEKNSMLSHNNITNDNTALVYYSDIIKNFYSNNTITTNNVKEKRKKKGKKGKKSKDKKQKNNGHSLRPLNFTFYNSTN